MDKEQEMDKEMEEKIDRIISTNTPCYRDIFGGKCEFITGCDKCPDYFNVRQEITAQISALFAGYVRTE